MSTRKLSFTPTDEQFAIEGAFKENRFTTIQAKSGSGKAQPLFCKVQTPQGEVEIGSLVVGQEIFKRDGTVGKVTGIFPQDGLQETFKVIFRDGTYTYCNAEHLWTVYGGKYSNKEMVKSLGQMMDRGLKNSRGGRKFRVPVCEAVQYPEKDFPIDPYTLGILIGDGYLCGGTPAFSVGKKDSEIFDIVKNNNPTWNFTAHVTGQNCVQWSFTDTPKNLTNGCMTKIKQLGLNVKSGEKFIPTEYLYGSKEQRLSLLQGLLDSDGSCNKNRTTFTTTSSRLNEDVRKLVRSLGGIATGNHVDKRKGSFCYTINIRMKTNPFRVESKAKLWSYSAKNPPAKYIDSVEYIGRMEQVCIAVDAEDHLYLTDDFIVTHNTSTLYMLANGTDDKILYLAFNKSMAEEARRKMPDNVECRTLHSICYQQLDQSLRHKLTRPEGAYVNVAGTGNEIAKKFKINNLIDKNGKTLLTRAMIGLMVKQTVGKFEFSDDAHLGRKHFPTVYLADLKRKNINENKLITEVVTYAKQLWRERIDPKSETIMTHDTYVKLFELSGKDLGYDIIFGDEFQDVNPAFLSILRNAKAAKRIVVVGDEFQSIYQFRGSQNMMKETSTYGVELPLTACFRFGPKVADVANMILEDKQPLAHPLVGKGYDTIVGSYVSDIVDYTKPYTIIFRKNLTLLMEAMDRIADGEDVIINVDTKDFISMVDSVNALRRGDIEKVKHETVLPYANWDEFVDCAESDPDAKRLLNIVVSGKANTIAYTLRTHRNSPNAKVTLTTAHKSKGLEWDQVVVANDFPSNYNKEREWVGLEEAERNLLYVAHTRCIKCLQWNSTVQEIIDIKRVEQQEHTRPKENMIPDLSRPETKLTGASGDYHLLEILERKVAQDNIMGDDY